MITGISNQSKTTSGESLTLEDLTSLTLESGVAYDTEAIGLFMSPTGQIKSGIFFWGDPIKTWGDVIATWGNSTANGVNQTRNDLISKSNQVKN